MTNYISFHKGNGNDNPTKGWQTKANTTAILSGQPAVIAYATSHPTQYVAAAATGTPVIGTDVLAGWANGNSSQTASADGSVQLYVPLPYQVLLLPAKVAANIATQSQYNALVNNRVLFDLTASVYTVNESATDNANNGLQIVANDITINPGLVAFTIRLGATWLY